MKVEEVIAGLKEYNEWRQGKETEMMHPAKIGVIINRAIELLAADGWQDIASAPRDGTRILIVNNEAPFPTAYTAEWVEDEGLWSVLMIHNGDGGSESFSINSPTHWKHLDEPPKKEATNV